LWASRFLEPARLLLLEPIPTLFAALEENARCHFPTAECQNIGLARGPGQLRFRHYPLAAGWSSYRRRDDLLRESLLVYLQRGTLSPGHAAFRLLGRLAPRLHRAVFDLVCRRIFKTAQDVDCPVDTLSGVIDRSAIPRIDLLKLDVEGAELDVLQGVRAEHWPRIHAVAAEVEDSNGCLDAATQLLDRSGFQVHARQAPELEGTPFHLILAQRPA
jgi:FkbM family methyltransferase